MANVFTSGAYVSSGQDTNNKKVLIAIQEASGNAALFNNCFLTNFESNRSADAAIMKNLTHGFMFTTFGKNPVTITVSGIYSGEGTYADDKDNTNNKLDPEGVFDLYNIGSKSRKILTITTMYGSTGENKDNKPMQYKGYMTQFRKNPLNDEKFNAYGFAITFIAAVSTSQEAPKADGK